MGTGTDSTSAIKTLARTVWFGLSPFGDLNWGYPPRHS
jgi:hypothetical protein